MSKLLFVLLVVAVVAVAGGAWTLLSEPIRAVRVEGTLTRGEQRAIRGVVTDALDRPLPSLDLDRVKQQIRSLSWPREVSIRRIWPAALLITVEKEAAVAIWGSEGFLTSDARVVQLPQGDDALPRFNCHLSTPKLAMEAFHLLQEALADHDLVIKVLAESTSGEWQVTLNNGVSVMLGNERILDRMRRFTLVYTKALEDRFGQVSHVDARYSNGIAVRWKPPNAPVQPNDGKYRGNES